MSTKRKASAAQATYRAEKARVHRKITSSHSQVMAEAKRLYDEQVERDRASRKGGRPKKKRAAEEEAAAEPEG